MVYRFVFQDTSRETQEPEVFGGGWRLRAPLTATQSEEPVVPASEYRSLLGQVRDLQRLLGKKTMEAEILKEALEFSAGSKKHLLRSLWWPKDGSR